MWEYIERNIDRQLEEWKNDPMRKPLLLRGARQVGKSSAVKNFGKKFKYFAEFLKRLHKFTKIKTKTFMLFIKYIFIYLCGF